MHAPTLPLAVSLTLALALAPTHARADVEDLTGGRVGPARAPATFVLRLHGGSDFAPYGRVGGSLSWFSSLAFTEVELGGGAGFPGTQLGLSLKKLFGGDNDFIVTEASIVYNDTGRGQTSGLQPAAARKAWTNLGFGFEHRGGTFDLAISGGLTILGFSESPTAFLQAGLGFGF